MLLLSIFLLFLTSTDAYIFPRICILSRRNITFPVQCCPTYNDSPCGANVGRGSCLLTPTNNPKPTENVNMDDRDKFPLFFFSSRCNCKGFYAGYNCGKCKFNRYGAYCEKIRPTVRVEVRQLTVTQRRKFIARLHYCKLQIDPEYYILRTTNRFQMSKYEFVEASYLDVWCFNHYYATKPFLNDNQEIPFTNYAHGCIGFLSWHRLFMLYMENQMQRCLNDDTFALVYYNWQDDPGCAMCTNDYFGANNEQGFLIQGTVFYSWKTVCGHSDVEATYCLMSDCLCERPKIVRQPGLGGVGKPNKQDVDYCKTRPNIDTKPYNREAENSFRNCIEGWVGYSNLRTTFAHNLWHVYIGGTMRRVPIACNDPLFFLHHTFIDKIFEDYIQSHNITSASYPSDVDIYGHTGDECITASHECWTHRSMFNPITGQGVIYL